MSKHLMSFHKLYHTYSSDVYRFAFYLSANEDDAKDICSETFYRAWVSKTDLNHKTIKSYLFTIARNLYLKSIKNIKIDLNESTLLSDKDTASQVENQEKIQYILNFLQKFPEEDRSAFSLRIHENLPYEEISKILCISVSNVKVKVYRIRQKIKEYCKEMER